MEIVSEIKKVRNFAQFNFDNHKPEALEKTTF